jgi:diaminopimelate epimerase
VIIPPCESDSPRCRARATTSSCSTPRAPRCSLAGAIAPPGRPPLRRGRRPDPGRRAGPSADVDFATASSTTPATRSSIAATAPAASCAIVHEQGLTDQAPSRVETVNNLPELHLQPDGRVTVDMNQPVFDRPHPVRRQRPAAAPRGWLANCGRWIWPGGRWRWPCCRWATRMPCLRVDDVTPRRWPAGPAASSSTSASRAGQRRLPAGADRSHVALRVYERDAGETLACGTGACAAVVAGIRLGWLDRAGRRATRGGRLTIEWAGRRRPVLMTGPADDRVRRRN